MSRRKRACAVGLLAGLALVWAVAWGWGIWKARAVLAEARRAVKRGEYLNALPLLSWLAVNRPGNGEAAFLLGECEASLGHPDAALAAWALVSEGSAAAGPAALRRGRLAIARSRFADAENALEAALHVGGPTATEARELVIRLLWRQGRFDEVASQIEDQWFQLKTTGRLSVPLALDLLRGHLSLDLETFPVDQIAAELRRDSDLAPDDDRVILARARWMIVAGRLDDARVLLDACVSRRPEDTVVWSAWLAWARAAGRLDEARKAFVHLPLSLFSERQVLGLRAWLASLRGDSVAERAFLKRLVAFDPGDIKALGRLVELLFQAGESEHAAPIRARVIQLDQAKHQYRILFKDDALATRPAEMGRLAGVLGRVRTAGALEPGRHARIRPSPDLRDADSR